MTDDIDLGPQLEAVVDDLIAKGRYGSKSEVLRDGVRLVRERETRLAALEIALAEGLADIQAGRIYPMEEVFAELEADLELLSNPAAGLAEA